MYLIDSMVTLFSLKWTQQEPQIRPLPPHIKRTFVKTPAGDLELLVCEPKPSTSKLSVPQPQPPIFFAHGGYGSAGVWLEWMTYLHNHNYSGTLYAYSVRNHGASYTLPYWRMVVNTAFEHIQADMVACLDYAIKQEQQQNSMARLPILVGHSSGGGLSQYLLSGISPDPALRVEASGLCLVGAIPSYGSYDIYWNWWKHDPWFSARSMFHLQHPTSPLSTEELVHGAFFGCKFPVSRIGAFKRWMPAFESMGWPTGMVGDNFWGWVVGRPNTWLRAKDIVSSIRAAGYGKDKVCVMVGKEDMMYRSWMWERQCREYRDGLRELQNERKLDDSIYPPREPDIVHGVASAESEDGVRMVLVGESGHHVQNDVYCDQAAEAFLRWANQV
ncbi:hypothetical protein LTR70_000435 [Exophiala xenobiotica]|uniref:AB hydrolase-1 domain-containing protein n=1 Tax=Lithohypha guttulata TaxID=1690604 RepID=A0ABR0KPW7_9EURO|nr:hypothetical protein LTR24_000136 [Lithohypha guttulata]KAK5330605.1 hypothetical protein LTR70_000435 [Exophiala xenobiotica]